MKQKTLGQIAEDAYNRAVSSSTYSRESASKKTTAYFTEAAYSAIIAYERRKPCCSWWSYGEMWESECGVAYELTNYDRLRENGHVYCHKCGKKIKVRRERRGTK